MSSAAKQQAGRTCIKCGAQQPRKRQFCWLCGAENMTDKRPHTIKPVQTTPQQFPFSLSTALLLISMAALSCGLWVGVHKWAGILVILIGLRTLTVVGIRGWRGRATSGLQSWSYFVGSAIVSIVMLVVLAFAAGLAFLAKCSSQGTSINGIPKSHQSIESGEDVAFLFVLSGGILVVGVIGWVFFRFFRDVRKK